MDVSEALEQIQRELIQQIRQLISVKYNPMMYAYYMVEATQDVTNLYKTIFKRYLHEVSPRLQEKILFAAMNLVFAIRSHLDLYTESPLRNLQTLATNFIRAQIEDYYEWTADLAPV